MTHQAYQYMYKAIYLVVRVCVCVCVCNSPGIPVRGTTDAAVVIIITTPTGTPAEKNEAEGTEGRYTHTDDGSTRVHSNVLTARRLSQTGRTLPSPAINRHTHTLILTEGP